MSIIQEIIKIASKYKIVYESLPTNYKDALTPILINDDVVQIFNELVKHNIIKEIIPEFMPCVGLEQKNKHHDYTCDQHILKSVEYIAKNKEITQHEKELLCWVMLMHDIGKPIALQRCLKRNYGYHFYNHGQDSAEIVKKRLPQLGFINIEELNQIETLVRHHDEYINLTNNEQVSEFKHKATIESIKRIIIYVDSEKNFELLLKVHYADIMAQSDFKRDYKLKLNEVCKELFEEIKKIDS